LLKAKTAKTVFMEKMAHLVSMVKTVFMEKMEQLVSMEKMA